MKSLLKKERQDFSDFASFISEYMKQSIIFSYSKVKEQYRIASILKGMNLGLMSPHQSYKPTTNHDDNHKMKVALETKEEEEKKNGLLSSMDGKEVSLSSMTQVVQLNQYRQMQEQIVKERSVEEEREQKQNDFLEYFRDESRIKLWWEYI